MSGPAGRRAGGLSTDARRAALEAFDRAIAREAHNIAQEPELLWQQLHNRLQWAEPPASDLVAEEARTRSEAGASLWMRTTTRFAESTALIRRLPHGESGAITPWRPIKILHCAISPDGTSVVSARVDDHTLKLWDTSTWQERATFRVHSPVGCAIGPRGDVVVAVSSNGYVQVLDAAAGREEEPLWDHVGDFSSCALSPDGSYVVAAVGHPIAEPVLRLWDLATRQARSIGDGHRRPLRSCAVSPDGSFVVSASEDGSLIIWDAASGRRRARLKGFVRGHRGAVQDCAISPDGTFVVSAGDDGTLKIWDVRRGRVRATLKGHSDSVKGCTVSPDGTFIVSASDDRTLKIWEVASGSERATLWGHTDAVTECAVSPDGRFIASASSDGTVQIWDADAKAKPAPGGHTQRLIRCAFGPGGDFVVSASLDQTACVWDGATGRERASFRHGAAATGCAVSPDGSYVVSSSVDKTLRFWDPVSGRERDEPKKHSDEVTCCAVSPDGSYVVAGTWNGLRLWDAATGRPRAHPEGYVSTVVACPISPDGARIVSADDDGAVRIWDAATATQHALLGEHEAEVVDCTISPDGDFVVSASADCSLKLWRADPAPGDEPRTLAGHTEPVLGCAISPDAGFVASASMDRTVRLWAVPSLEPSLEIVSSIRLLGSLSGVALHPWKPRLACGDAAGNLYLVDLVGVEYGPIVVTAVERGARAIVTCPACRQAFPLEQNWLGDELDCPNPDCGTRLRVNPFVAREPRWQRQFPHAATPDDLLKGR